MGFKKFDSKDLIYNQIITNPKFKFLIHTGSVYLQNEKSKDGDFSNKIKHVSQGHVNLHELNINRPSDKIIFPFVHKSSERLAFNGSSITSISDFDNTEISELGDQIAGSYPMSASVSRIFIPAGFEINEYDATGQIANQAHANKKYIRSLRNTILWVQRRSIWSAFQEFFMAQK